MKFPTAKRQGEYLSLVGVDIVKSISSMPALTIKNVTNPPLCPSRGICPAPSTGTETKLLKLDSNCGGEFEGELNPLWQYWLPTAKKYQYFSRLVSVWNIMQHFGLDVESSRYRDRR